MLGSTDHGMSKAAIIRSEITRELDLTGPHASTLQTFKGLGQRNPVKSTLSLDVLAHLAQSFRRLIHQRVEIFLHLLVRDEGEIDLGFLSFGH